MDNEQYAFVLGALSRLDRKMDFILARANEPLDADAEEDTRTIAEDEEFDL